MAKPLACLVAARQHVGRLQHCDAISSRVRAGAPGEIAHIGVDHGIDRVDRDGAAAQRLHARFQGRLRIKPPPLHPCVG